jgi:hypothetical protein
MLLEIQTIAPASSSSLAESVSGPPLTSESIRKPVAAIALTPSTATSAIPTARNSRDLRVIEPGSATTSTTSRAASSTGNAQFGRRGEVVGLDHLGAGDRLPQRYDQRLPSLVAGPSPLSGAALSPWARPDGPAACCGRHRLERH